MLKEGRNGNPLFVCGDREQTAECCDMVRVRLYIHALETQRKQHVHDYAPVRLS